MKNNFIAIAMSGGVDSSVAAWLLKKLNYKLLGVFMINWIDEKNCYKKDLKDMILVSNFLNIKIKIINFHNIYKKKIFYKFLKNYKLGITPNPDIWCNKKIKFNILLKYVLSLGIERLATGHYAKIRKISNKNLLLKSKDKNKDQTYFLYKLNQKQLSKIIFPLENICKKDVRKIAQKIKLHNAYKKDSTGICFIEEKNFNFFLNKFLPKNKGLILNEKNKYLGYHNGLWFYTLGQRKGLGIGGIKNKINKPWYVTYKEIKTNTIYVVQNKNHPWLLSSGLIADKVSWIKGKAPKNRNYFTAKIRHNTIYSVCFYRIINKNKFLLIFNKLQRAVTPGQSVVLYDKNFCIGGGEIKKSINFFKK